MITPVPISPPATSSQFAANWGFTAFIVGLLFCRSFDAVGAPVFMLPATLASAVGSSTNRGFTVSVAQAAAADAPLANSYLRAYRQINGTLVNQAGTLVSNVAPPGPNTAGRYHCETVNFEKDGAEILVADATGAVVAIFDTDLFPGIPGSEGSTTNFAIEVVTFITLAAGTNWFGISFGADRTDAVDDDGFQVFTAANPRDFLGIPTAKVIRQAFDPLAPDQHLETQFGLATTVGGIYPLRILYWQTGRGANLQFYSIDPLTAERILVNDPLNLNAVTAYTDSNLATAQSPYLAEVSPFPGSSGNAATNSIHALLIAGAVEVNTNSVALYLNGIPVPATLAKVQPRVTVSYQPASWSQATNTVTLIYQDTQTDWHTNSWSFTVDLTGNHATVVTGQWDFDAGDLRATIGQNLAYLDPTFDGPAGTAMDRTEFGTTTSLGIAALTGGVAHVMRIPGGLDDRYGYAMHHLIQPNGGGTRVNQYTLIMDIMVATNGARAAALMRVQENGAADGDLFWQTSQFGQGNNGYLGTQAFTPGAWHRIVAAYNEAAFPPVVTKYVDGIFQDDWTANQGLDHPRRSLLPVAYLFADGTPADERREMWINSIQIRRGVMSKAEIEALGGPSASGIPQPSPSAPTLEFQQTPDHKLKLLWPAAISGYILESSPTPSSVGNWEPVAGVSNNSAEVTIGTGSRFFRLRRL